MYSEPNLHSRNLKVASLMFILYWLLDLTPVDSSIRLLVINYEVRNPSALFWVAHILLIYFAWRFYLSSRYKIIAGYQKATHASGFTNQQSIFFKFIHKQSEKDYETKHKKDFQQKRKTTAIKENITSYNNIEYRVNPMSLRYIEKQLCLEYQIEYKGTRLPDNMSRNYIIKYKRNQLIWLKALILSVFLLGKEETPDYLIPWCLFGLALFTSLLENYGISISRFFK